MHRERNSIKHRCNIWIWGVLRRAYFAVELLKSYKILTSIAGNALTCLHIYNCRKLKHPWTISHLHTVGATMRNNHKKKNIHTRIVCGVNVRMLEESLTSLEASRYQVCSLCNWYDDSKAILEQAWSMINHSPSLQTQGSHQDPEGWGKYNALPVSPFNMCPSRLEQSKPLMSRVDENRNL